MFKKTTSHLQLALKSNVNDLPEKHRQRLEQSWAGVFYREFFCRIDEEPFEALYADIPSRPNVHVNILMGLDTLKAGFGWSDEEMHDAFFFDLQVRYELGLHQLGQGDFDVCTVYNFRSRVVKIMQETRQKEQSPLLDASVSLGLTHLAHIFASLFAPQRQSCAVGY